MLLVPHYVYASWLIGIVVLIVSVVLVVAAAVVVVRVGRRGRGVVVVDAFSMSRV